MDNKKNGIPKLRFPGFTGAWEQRKFSEILAKSDGLRRGPFGSALKKEFFISSSEYTVYEQNNAIYNTWKTRYFITPEKFQELHKFQLVPGDFILSGAGTIGRIAQVPANITKGVFNQALIRIRINPEWMDKNFFLIWMQSENMQRKLTQANPGSAMTNLVPMSEIKKWEIIIPSKAEQNKIGEFIQKLNSLIALHQRKLEHLQEQKKGLLQKMFPKNGEIVPEVRFPGFTDAWKQRKLGEVVKKSTIKNSDLEYSKDDILSVATMSDMNFSREINSTKDYMKTYNKILYGEIAFEGHSSKNYKFGRFVLNDYRNGIVSHIYDIYKITINYDMKFMKEWISLDKVMYKPLVNSTTNARMMNSLQAKNLYKQKVLLPNLQEQKEIGKFLKKVDSLIVLHQRKLDHLELMKKGLLQQMFV